jgi:hypothetical protein
MDRDLYKLWCFLGIAVALAVFFPLGAKRRACVSPVVWWGSLILGGVTCIYGLTHATAPSFAARITAIGRTYDYVERTHGTWPYKDTFHGFRFVPDGGEPVNIETEIILPGWEPPTYSLSSRMTTARFSALTCTQTSRLSSSKMQ